MHALVPTWRRSFSSFCHRYCRLLNRNITSKGTGRSSSSPHNRYLQFGERLSKAFQVTPGLGKCTKYIFFKFSFTVSRVNEALATLTDTQSPFRQWGKGIFVYSPRKLEFKELEHLPQLSKIMKKSIIFIDMLLQSGRKYFHYNMTFKWGFEGLRTASCTWEMMSLSEMTKYHLVHLGNFNYDSKFVWWSWIKRCFWDGLGEEKKKNGRKMCVQMEICRHYNICCEGLNICIIQNL